MEIIIAKQCKTLAESFVMGLIFGAGYDIIRILYVLWGIQSYTTGVRQKVSEPKRVAFWLFLAGDILFMLCITCCASLFLYHANHGQFRLYLAAGCVAGFCLYHCTLGRLVMLVSETIVCFLKKLLYNTVIRPVRWVAGMLFTMGRFLVKISFGNAWKGMHTLLLRRRMYRCMRRFPDFVRL